MEIGIYPDDRGPTAAGYARNKMKVGVYLHVPFCRRKCAYCDFVSYPAAAADMDGYVRAVKTEIARRGAAAGAPPMAASLYVGGGTPTVLPVEALVEILDAIRRSFHWPPGLEATVEANPETVHRSDLERLRRSGINRLSIGMQAAQDALLAVLGRGHRLDDVREAVRLARRAGFESLNLDLISGIPGQTTDDWRRTLEAALVLEPEHIAAYSLEITPGTALYGRVERGEVVPAPEDRVLEMFHATREVLTCAGYEQYEIANFARPGHACRHNLIYWRNEPYLGFGPAAHSCWQGWRWANERDPATYAAHLDAGGLPVAESEKMDLRTEMAETMFLGLRLRRGVERERFRRRFGRDLDTVYGVEIARLQDQGLLEERDGCLRLTERGLPVANVVFEEFL
jgi:oxygen-independent coproporphyrinogen-3 oxidase